MTIKKKQFSPYFDPHFFHLSTPSAWAPQKTILNIFEYGFNFAETFEFLCMTTLSQEKYISEQSVKIILWVKTSSMGEEIFNTKGRGEGAIFVNV